MGYPVLKEDFLFPWMMVDTMLVENSGDWVSINHYEMKGG